MDPNGDFLFLRMGEYPIGYSCWSLWAGFLVTSLAMILWRPQSRVFLDRICISQTDVALKTQAIFSLAGLLKKSDSMLILWDPSWTERLWCLFELAAFLQSKKDLKKELIIRPTFLGPVHIAVFLTCVAGMIPLTMAPIDVSNGAIAFVVPAIFMCLSGFVVFYVAMSTLRRYFRDLDIMKQQLLSISFDTARSSCCDTNHVGASGAPVICDRRIVQECVNVWFGSQDTRWRFQYLHCDFPECGAKGSRFLGGGSGDVALFASPVTVSCLGLSRLRSYCKLLTQGKVAVWKRRVVHLQ